MEEQQIPPAIESKEKRPTLLTLLCILSFIGSGLNAFSNLMVFIFYDTSMRFAAEMMKSFKITGIEPIPGCQAHLFCSYCPDQCTGYCRCNTNVAAQEDGISYVYCFTNIGDPCSHVFFPASQP